MKNILIALLLTVISFSVRSNFFINTYLDSPDIEKIDTNMLFGIRHETQPQFPGGEEALSKYLIKNIKLGTNFEQADLSKFYIQFTIDNNGNVINVNCIRCENTSINKQAIKAVENMPKWIPAKRLGKPINIKYTIPIWIHPR